jgi:hypothetical protein
MLLLEHPKRGIPSKRILLLVLLIPIFQQEALLGFYIKIHMKTSLTFTLKYK